jgi:inorganic pyrophosphatase
MIVDAVIEIPFQSNIKYEIDKNGHLRVDRILSTSMHYPGNYGYIPGTLAGDGDPVDILLLRELSFHPGCRVRCRVIGLLETTDEKGQDEKVLAVTTDDPRRDIKELQQSTLDKIKHFFQNYKSLEKNKQVSVGSFKNAAEAARTVEKLLLG